MNKDLEGAVALASGVREGLTETLDLDVALAPPFPFLAAVGEAVRGSRVGLAAQNCHFEEKGAFTGEVSPLMLKSVGCSHVILGHSERRAQWKESDELINSKVKAVLKAGLHVILCVGETLEQRQAGQLEAVVSRQVRDGLEGISASDLDSLVMAYEPVWAIGTGVTATPEQAAEAHRLIRGMITEKYGRERAKAFRIQYGGSVKPGNIKDLMAKEDIDGALVGGASLQAESFLAIIRGAVS